MKSAENPLPHGADTVYDRVKRLLLIVLASVVMAANIKSFVEAGGLFPGGFNGLTLLIQRSAQQFFDISLSFTVVNFLLNAVPAAISFRLIGKRFTLYSCLMIVLTSVLTDLIPAMPLTNDVLLVCIFGGIINGFAISLCLLGRATSGGTDFIAVALSERLNIDAWNYILLGNAAMLVIAGVLFGWDKALYSIIFQFASTQVVHMINPRYKRTTLFIISNKADEIYEQIKDVTHHGATLFRGTGLYNGEERDMLYSVISGDQVKLLTRRVRETDPKAFINILKTDQVAGNFYQRPHD
ncbi:YitT family protein [Agathobaculum sp.]|uniref:YitT family protein n=1 Tax=Agathobaculum sp. TaxID=2048138 RepID=UPI002A7FB060|nr:YitT family protein [Agathobaculum sp.]MDY3618335.1 YitT family protein [Agathobaculum sp.]